MEYAIQDVAQIIGARTKALHDCTVSTRQSAVIIS